ncbi:bacteriocin immunity protein, partial [Pseudomonas lactis]
KVIKMKTSISEYTESEFLKFVISLCDASARSEEEDDEMLLEFKRLTEHPDGSDLVYYPRKGREDSPEGIVKEVKEWRANNGKPGFRIE